MELVNLVDLIERPFYFYLSNEGRCILFNNNDLKVLSIKLGCSHKTLVEIANGSSIYGRRFIEAELFRKLLNLSNVSPKEIEKNILAVKRGKSTRPVEIKLPILCSYQLSLLFAKAIGDGCICTDWRFDYKNTSMELLREVIQYVEESIGKSKYTLHKRNNNSFDLKFSPVVGFVLFKIGIPRGRKINQDVQIPDWIRQGDIEIKNSFLKGLFDDESCVDPKGKRIIIAFGKEEKLKNSLIIFLTSIRDMLKELNIDAGNINFQENYGGRVVYRFGIYGKENLNNFKNQIDSSHIKKRNALNLLINGYIDKQIIKKKVLETVLNSNLALTSLQISEICDVNLNLTKHHLFKLAEEGRISKTFHSKPALWHHIGNKLMNKKEKILRLISTERLTAFEVSKLLNMDQKYVFFILDGLKNEGLILCDRSHPRIWSAK